MQQEKHWRDWDTVPELQSILQTLEDDEVTVDLQGGPETRRYVEENGIACEVES